MRAYYNEFDRKAAAWLRELIARGLIAPGDVDERSISDVQGSDLAGYTQCHFFAGIGGWSIALRLAGWPDDRPVWTGSCPCQPFSSAGKRKGTADERHLWPEWFRLIRECRPERVFGEQVEGAIRHGWLDGVSADLEAEGYAVGAVVLGAHSVGAPHIRQRLWWGAESGGEQCEMRGSRNVPCATSENERATRPEGHGDAAGSDGPSGGLADAEHQRSRAGEPREQGHARQRRDRPAIDGEAGGLDHAEQPGLEGHAGHEHDRNEPGRLHQDAAGPVAEAGGDRGLEHAHGDQRPGQRLPHGRAPEAAGAGPWSNAVWIPCADGKARRIEPGLAPLAHGVPARVVRLRGYGNAIVPPVAAEFITAYINAKQEIEG